MKNKPGYKAIFLDIDGVLRPFKKKLNIEVSHSEWCPEKLNEHGIKLKVYKRLIKRINKITDATGARLILSSSWRVGYLSDWADVVVYLHNMGLKGFIIGRTPWNKKYKTRGQEISAWFSEHPEENIKKFIIFDDDEHMEPFNDHLIHTDHTKGIESKHVDLAIKMLKDDK